MAYAIDVSGERLPGVRKIKISDLNEALARGIDDFQALPTFAAFVVFIYPVIGLVLLALTFGYELLPIVFPVLAGFPLIAPVAAVGLYELSRRREKDLPVSWDALDDISGSCVRAVATLGGVLVAIFAAWIGAAVLLYNYIFGTWVPPSVGDFAHEVFYTRPGWSLILLGCAIGFVFAALAFSISVVSFPMLLDRDVSAVTAMRTSLRAVAENPIPMAAWALFIAVVLALATAPVFIGLIVALPILGHATWHLYRKVVEPAS